MYIALTLYVKYNYLSIYMKRQRFFLIISLLVSFSLFFLFFRVITPDSEIITENKDLSRGASLIEAIIDNVSQNEPESPNLPLRMLFFGDLMLDRHVGEKINKYGLDHLLGKLNEDSFTKNYDLVGANLEGATTNNGEHYLPHNAYDFAFSPSLISELKKYNFNFFALANNHLSDQGKKGIDETYKNLSDIQFNYVGCSDAYLSSSTEIIEAKFGNDFPILNSNNCSDIILEMKNHKVGFLSLSLVYHDIDSEKIIERIKALKEKSDLVIVNIHFGLEYQAKANQKQEQLAHSMIDNGADVIIGHHPHVIQNYEVYKGKPIFYSLGNFIFDQYFSAETQEGLAIALDIDWENNLEKNEPKIDFVVYKIRTKGSQIVEITKTP